MSTRKQDDTPQGDAMPAPVSSTVLDVGPVLATVQHAGQMEELPMSKNTDTSAAAQTQALATPPAGTDAKTIRTAAAGIAVALDSVRDAYNVARTCWNATAPVEEGGQGISVRPLADAVTRARVLKRHPGADGDTVAALSQDAAYRVSKSSVANYAASFGFLVAHGIISPETYRAAQMLRNRADADALATVAGELSLSDSPEARQLAFIAGVRSALEVLAGERAAERDAQREAREAAADAAVSDAGEGTDADESGDESAPVGMSADVAVATLDGIGAQAWSAKDRKRILSAMLAAAQALRDGSADGSKVAADADATIAALS